MENNPDIIIQYDRFVHTAGAYRAEVVIYAIHEEVGEDDEVIRHKKEVYSFQEIYKGTSCGSMSKCITTRVAEWLLENGYSGLVAITGNAAEFMTHLSGTGITRYNTGDSELYLSPYKKLDARSKRIRWGGSHY